MHRFYVPNSFDADSIELTGDEAAHMLRVLRLPVGAHVTLFDGFGRAAVAVIVEAKKRSARLQICQRLTSHPSDRPEVILVTCVPKADRFRWLIEKATELGVNRLIPIQTERSVVHPGRGKLARMEAASVAACKQCGRNDLLQIDQLQPWNEVVSCLGSRMLLVADPSGRALRDVSIPFTPDSSVVLAVGPEGGFTPMEIALAQSCGGEIVQLGTHILRIETAALALVAWLTLNSTQTVSESLRP
jgi:16S rRNA (uracil1498-N3)-methyltransferase